MDLDDLHAVTGSDQNARRFLRHGKRVGRVVRAVAEAWGVSSPVARRYERAAWLHDIGKTALPDSLFRKRGPLTEEEFETVRLHTVLGDRMLAEWESALSDVFREAARSHHERWDGSGYPDGWAGAAIPLAARLTAVADAFDAILHPRPYQAASSAEQAFAELREAAGSQLDPEIVEVCLANRQTILRSCRASAPDEADGAPARVLLDPPADLESRAAPAQS